MRSLKRLNARMPAGWGVIAAWVLIVAFVWLTSDAP